MAGSERTETGTEARTSPAAATGTEARAEAGTHERLPGSGNQEGRRQSLEAKSVPGPAPTPEAIEHCTVSCLTNAQYHASREAFLDTVHRWIMFLVIALGGAALTDILPKLTGTDAKLTTDLLVATGAILAALDLTFDLSNRARTHAMMRRRYFELLADMRDGYKKPEDVRVCIERFSADEEPQFKVLYLACWNAAQEAVYGDAKHRYEIGFFSNLFKNLWRRPTADFQFIDGQVSSKTP